MLCNSRLINAKEFATFGVAILQIRIKFEIIFVNYFIKNLYFQKIKKKAAFANISEIISNFFYKYDVVPSDIIAGLVLIRENQKSVKSQVRFYFILS